MEFEWDPAKDESNLRKHGLSFATASLIFQGHVVTRRSYTRTFGEARPISIGEVAGLMMVTVVHTGRNGRVRIISARKARPKERAIYYGIDPKET